MEGEEGEAVMEEVGTWWWTLGPVGGVVSWGDLMGLGWDGETFGDVEGGEEDCFEHFIRSVELHMP